MLDQVMKFTLLDIILASSVSIASIACLFDRLVFNCYFLYITLHADSEGEDEHED